MENKIEMTLPKVILRFQDKSSVNSETRPFVENWLILAPK